MSAIDRISKVLYSISLRAIAGEWNAFVVSYFLIVPQLMMIHTTQSI